jgi:hypothetical protein
VEGRTWAIACGEINREAKANLYHCRTLYHQDTESQESNTYWHRRFICRTPCRTIFIVVEYPISAVVKVFISYMYTQSQKGNTAWHERCRDLLASIKLRPDGQKVDTLVSSRPLLLSCTSGRISLARGLVQGLGVAVVRGSLGALVSSRAPGVLIVAIEEGKLLDFGPFRENVKGERGRRRTCRAS